MVLDRLLGCMTAHCWLPCLSPENWSSAVQASCMRPALKSLLGLNAFPFCGCLGACCGSCEAVKRSKGPRVHGLFGNGWLSRSHICRSHGCLCNGGQTGSRGKIIHIGNLVFWTEITVLNLLYKGKQPSFSFFKYMDSVLS